jgi:hypothetical protein
MTIFLLLEHHAHALTKNALIFSIWFSLNLIFNPGLFKIPYRVNGAGLFPCLKMQVQALTVPTDHAAAYEVTGLEHRPRSVVGRHDVDIFQFGKRVIFERAHDDKIVAEFVDALAKNLAAFRGDNWEVCKRVVYAPKVNAVMPGVKFLRDDLLVALDGPHLLPLPAQVRGQRKEKTHHVNIGDAF